MARASLSAFVLVALAAGCKEGDVIFDDAGPSGDAGPGHDAGATPEPDAGATPEPDAGASDAGATPGADAAMADAGAGELDVAALADALAGATCEALAECAGHADLLAELLGGRDCATVVAGDLRNGELASLPEAIAAGRVVYDGRELDACADDLAALGCDARSRRWPASCELLLLGTVDLGGDCAIDQECAGDAFCLTDATCPGTCTALLAEDGACADGDDDQCEDGLVCSRATSTCAPLGGNGDDCGDGVPPCAPGFVCVDDGSGARCTGLAVVYFRAQGEACSPGSGGCAAGVTACGDVELCEPGLVCESAASGGSCAPPTPASGGACRRAVPNQCPLEQVCDAQAPGEDGRCVDRPGATEPCLSRTPRCAPGHACVDDICVELLDNGAACGDDRQCLGGVCGANGRCESAASCAP